jgi:acyl-CoA thioester hydrolase
MLPGASTTWSSPRAQVPGGIAVRTDLGISATVELRVSFHDLDPLCVVWHGNYLKYFEVAREALLREHGVDLFAYHEQHRFLFPVVRTATKHVYPLRHDDVFTVEARLVEARTKLVLDYVVRRQVDGTVCCRGRTEQVAVSLPDQRLELQLPEDLLRALGVPE